MVEDGEISSKSLIIFPNLPRLKMANKRKKKQKEEDFKKTKLKVGKSLPKGGNETNTSFSLKKISIPLQDVMKEKNLTNIHNKDLKDLLTNIQHYKASVRKEALHGLKSLFEQHQSELQENLNKIFISTVPLMHDLDSDVRIALLNLLDFILTTTTPNEVEPYFLLLVNHLNCAMTHINEDVQLSSLKFLDVLIKYAPENMQVNYRLVLDNLLGLIVSYSKDSQSKAKVTVVADGKFASRSSKNKVLQQVYHVLNILYGEDTPNQGVFENHSTVAFPCPHIAVFDNCAQLPSLSRFNFSVNPTSNSAPSTNISLQSLMETIIPALLQLWIECLPSSCSTSQQNGPLSSESLSVLVTIIRIIKLLFSATKQNIQVNNWLVTTHEREFKKHILSSFPYQGNVVTTKKKSPVSELSQVDMLLTLDITICEVMTIFLDEKKTAEQAPWKRAVEDFIINVLNSQAVSLKVEHLQGICRYTGQLVAARLYEVNNDSVVQLLRSLFKVYESSHLLSSIKTKLMLFFGEVYETVHTHVTSDQGVPESLMAILIKWRKTIPTLLVQCPTQEGNNEEFVKIIVSLLSKLITRFTESSYDQEVELQLKSFLDSGALSTMSYTTQKAVVELIFSLPEIGYNLVHSIVVYCHRQEVPAQIVQDIITMIYQRSQACQIFTKLKAVPSSTCFSALFSIAVGYSAEKLSNFKSGIDEQSMFRIHEGDINAARKALQRQGDIIKVFDRVCKYQCYGPRYLEKHLLPALDNLLNSYKTLPLPAASSILLIYKCYCELITTAGSMQTTISSQSYPISSWKTVAKGIAKLAMSSLEYAVQEENTQNTDVKQHLYNSVIDDVTTCPVLAKELFQMCADGIEERKVFIILCRLTESLSQHTLLTLSSEVSKVVNDLKVKVERYYPENATFKAHCEFLLHK